MPLNGCSLAPIGARFLVGPSNSLAVLNERERAAAAAAGAENERERDGEKELGAIVKRQQRIFIMMIIRTESERENERNRERDGRRRKRAAVVSFFIASQGRVTIFFRSCESGQQKDGRAPRGQFPAAALPGGRRALFAARPDASRGKGRAIRTRRNVRRRPSATCGARFPLETGPIVFSFSLSLSF